MVRKRSKTKGTQIKPFCYYCDRDFEDEPTLVQHQKAKGISNVKYVIKN